MIGQAENTASKTSTPWVIVLQHEHFHQLQFAQPDYNSALGSLNLSHGDQSGDWMLNYAFPYADEKTAAAYKELATTLLNMLKSPPELSEEEFRKRAMDYLALRANFKTNAVGG